MDICQGKCECGRNKGSPPSFCHQLRDIEGLPFDVVCHLGYPTEHISYWGFCLHLFAFAIFISDLSSATDCCQLYATLVQQICSLTSKAKIRVMVKKVTSLDGQFRRSFPVTDRTWNQWSMTSNVRRLCATSPANHKQDHTQSHL